MIMLFSIMTSVAILSYKKKQIAYIDDLIFLGERIILLLGSTMPDTSVLFSRLQNEERLKKYDVKKIDSFSPLTNAQNDRIAELLTSVGRYDSQTQIDIAKEFTGYFKELKKQYSKHYETHAGLYIAFGISGGLIVSLMLI